jgi:mRNA interferase MazF
VSAAARGEVWLASLDPTRGHEQAGRRPVVIVSDDLFNRGPAGLVIVLPVTTRLRSVRSHVVLEPPEGGLKSTSVILCEAVRSIATERLTVRWGAVSALTLAKVEDALRILMRL